MAWVDAGFFLAVNGACSEIRRSGRLKCSTRSLMGSAMLDDRSNIELSDFTRFMRRERMRARHDSEEFIRNVEAAREALENGFAMPAHLCAYFSPNGRNDGELS